MGTVGWKEKAFPCVPAQCSLALISLPSQKPRPLDEPSCIPPPASLSLFQSISQGCTLPLPKGFKSHQDSQEYDLLVYKMGASRVAQ